MEFFFFSSRRRHTRCSRDWSSDVCSSDLGPTLVVDSSVHGQEITGTLAIKKLLRELAPRSLSGTLVCAPCVNAPSFDAVARVNVLERDPRNMDQVFPGHEMGTLAEMTAYHYYNK